MEAKDDKIMISVEAATARAQPKKSLSKYIIFVHVLFNTLGFMFTHSFNILPSYMLWNIQSQEGGTG